MSVRIALAGNPNSGKTSLFNRLTGSTQYVGNWPGVTVEKKDGRLKGYPDVILVDLPGIYSLSPYSPEEVVARDFLTAGRPDAVINLVDATNIERNLYLTTQLIETGIPVVIALNMIDVVRKRGDRIDAEKLSRALGVPVVETSALKGDGLTRVAALAVEAAQYPVQAVQALSFSDTVETALHALSGILAGRVPEPLVRFYAVKLFERDPAAMEKLSLDASALQRAAKIISQAESSLTDDAESSIINERYESVGRLVASCVFKQNEKDSVTEKIDRIVTNRYLALPIFAAIMWLIYTLSVSSVGAVLTGWVGDVLFGTWITGWADAGLTAAGAEPWLYSLIIDGIIGGVGGVLSFVPQMFILFFFLSVLEDTGYMARVAFMMDRIFRRFGLSGKSFIPLLISSGCGVPGIMASRTIESDRDRRMTMIVTTFIPCSAKLPMIALISGALFRGVSWVAPTVYLISILAVVLSGLILKRTRLFAGSEAPFVMELPPYRLPSASMVARHVWERGKAFIVKAGTVIFLACGLIWFSSSFGWDLRLTDAGDSMLSSMGAFLAPIFAPLGFGFWQASVASLTGLAAKENVVGVFGVLLGLNEEALQGGVAGLFTPVSAFAFLVFNLLCAPCFAAIAAIRREMGSLKWTFIAVGYQTALAYGAAFVIYQLGGVLFLGSPFGPGAALAAALLLGVTALLFGGTRPGKPLVAAKAFQKEG